MLMYTLLIYLLPIISIVLISSKINAENWGIGLPRSVLFYLRTNLWIPWRRWKLCNVNRRILNMNWNHFLPRSPKCIYSELPFVFKFMYLVKYISFLYKNYAIDNFLVYAQCTWSFKMFMSYLYILLLFNHYR